VFARNAIGIYAAGTGATTVQNGRFEDHGTAAVWVYSGSEPATPEALVSLSDNEFRNDAMGIVIVNANARVERNLFDGLRRPAVYASGGHLVIARNRMRAGWGFGISAERLQSARIERNEIARHCDGAVMLREVGNAEVISNELYQNGYGVVLMAGAVVRPSTVAENLIADHVLDGVVMIGSSPIVRRNRVLRNRQAGLRLSALRIASGETVVPMPLLDGNVVIDNGRDEPERDAYEPAASTREAAAVDCAWRVGGTSIYHGGPSAAAAVARAAGR
jgi:hypothetical protein